jgi:hypothetical protein
MKLNTEEFQALSKIIDYLEESEFKHFKECEETDETYNNTLAKNHIWHSVLLLSNKVDEYKMLKTVVGL